MVNKMTYREWVTKGLDLGTERGGDLSVVIPELVRLIFNNFERRKCDTCRYLVSNDCMNKLLEQDAAAAIHMSDCSYWACRA